MSTRALVAATAADLRDFLADPNGRISGVQPSPGMPPNNFGQWYYAVHGGGISGDEATGGQAHDRLHAVLVTLTARMAYAPKDRKGDRLTQDDELLERAEAVADRLHMSYVVMNAANALIAGFGVTVNGFVEPYQLREISPATAAAATWAGGKDGDPDVLVCTVTLGGARRVRPLS